MSDITFTKDQVNKLCVEAHIQGQMDGMRLMCNRLIEVLPLYRNKFMANIEELKNKR